MPQLAPSSSSQRKTPAYPSVHTGPVTPTNPTLGFNKLHLLASSRRTLQVRRSATSTAWRTTTPCKPKHQVPASPVLVARSALRQKTRVHACRPIAAPAAHPINTLSCQQPHRRITHNSHCPRRHGPARTMMTHVAGLEKRHCCHASVVTIQLRWWQHDKGAADVPATPPSLAPCHHHQKNLQAFSPGATLTRTANSASHPSTRTEISWAPLSPAPQAAPLIQNRWHTNNLIQPRPSTVCHMLQQLVPLQLPARVDHLSTQRC